MKRLPTAILLVGVLTGPCLGAYQVRRETPFVKTVERLAAAVEADDYDAFAAYFTARTIGMQPEQLWRGARGVIGRFAKVVKITFSEFDDLAPEGAYVTVKFESATRDVFIRLQGEKIKQLEYVPPTNN